MVVNVPSNHHQCNCESFHHPWSLSFFSWCSYELNKSKCVRCRSRSSSHLAKISFSSCSETNWPRLATNRVEQGALAASGGLGGCGCCWLPPVDDPTGLARAGLGKKWRGGIPACTCIEAGCMAAGWVMDMCCCCGGGGLSVYSIPEELSLPLTWWWWCMGCCSSTFCSGFSQR